MKYTVIIAAAMVLCAFFYHVRLRFSLLFAAAIVLFTVCGCAALPMPMQPAAEQQLSNQAEGAWLVLDAVDTLQTMRMNKNGCQESDPMAVKVYGTNTPSPGHVLAINTLIAIGHTAVSAWLDEEYAKHANDKSAWAWLTGRTVWAATALAYSAQAVHQNQTDGCGL